MTIKILNRVAAKREKPLYTSRGTDHAGMIGSRQRIPSGPVALSLLAGHSQRKKAGHMTAQPVQGISFVRISLTHGSRPHMTLFFVEPVSSTNPVTPAKAGVPFSF